MGTPSSLLTVKFTVYLTPRMIKLVQMLTLNQVQKRLQRQKVVAEILMQNQQLRIQMQKVKKTDTVPLLYYHSNKLGDIELDQHQHQIQEIALNHYSVASYQRI